MNDGDGRRDEMREPEMNVTIEIQVVGDYFAEKAVLIDSRGRVRWESDPVVLGHGHVAARRAEDEATSRGWTIVDEEGDGEEDDYNTCLPHPQSAEWDCL